MDQTLGKEYKLCSQKVIQEIFEVKKVVKQFPLVLNYKLTQVPTGKSFQMVFAAPKRIFRKAHDRNRIKRLCRETVRKNKLIIEDFLTENQSQVALFLVYTNKEELPYEVLLKKTEQLFQKLVIQLKEELRTI
ncbi:MAG: ribonuclease P protein component [Crocinitomicaceae bacterium]|nr:ribonuclease P protein component [Crocinitomicaceae bacterium]